MPTKKKQTFVENITFNVLLCHIGDNRFVPCALTVASHYVSNGGRVMMRVKPLSAEYYDPAAPRNSELHFNSAWASINNADMYGVMRMTPFTISISDPKILIGQNNWWSYVRFSPASRVLITGVKGAARIVDIPVAEIGRMDERGIVYRYTTGRKLKLAHDRDMRHVDETCLPVKDILQKYGYT